MNSKIIAFLKKERVGVLSVILPEGIPHSATVHFSENLGALKLYIQTSNTTTKVKPFLNGESGKAAFVIGFSEQEWLTLQMRGNIRSVTDKNELERIYTIHNKKQPEAEQYKGPKTVFLEFTPTWYRFSDFNSEPETIIENLIV